MNFKSGIQQECGFSFTVSCIFVFTSSKKTPCGRLKTGRNSLNPQEQHNFSPFLTFLPSEFVSGVLCLSKICVFYV